MIFHLAQSSDLDVLLDFKKQVSRDPNGILMNWSSKIHFCNWTGVTCHPKHRHRVQVLDFANQDLLGTLPPSLGRLERLEFLRILSNHFVGTIPVEIGNCTSLKVLSLGNNSLIGELPDSVFHNLKHLERFYVWGNQLRGNIPVSIGNCTRLKDLDLALNNLTGTIIPEMFHGLQHLELLYFYGNNLHGEIPASIGNCTRLKDLRLPANALSGIIPDMFSRMQRLKILYIFDTNVHGEIPTSIGNCTRLEELDLSHNILVGMIPSWPALPQITFLSLRANQLQGQIPRWIQNCTTTVEIIALDHNDLSGNIPSLCNTGLQYPKRNHMIKRILLHVNRLSGVIPVSLTNCSSLEVLEFSANLLGGSIPPEIGTVYKLEILHLQKNLLSGSIPSTIGNLTSVIDLSLSFNQLIGEIPPTLGSLINIQAIALTRCNLSGAIPAYSLKQCKHLAYLGLGGNNLDKQIPPEIGEIQSLRKLYLYDNRLTGEIPNSIGNLPRLEHLDLANNKLEGLFPDSLRNLRNSLENTIDISFNNLQGEIPPWIGDFDKTVNIMLASNNFSGVIPPSIGQCKGLVTLNLSSNQLSGGIPQELGKLLSLQVLDLSVNNLSGPIPTTLTASKDLARLNLSWNNLEGPIPLTGVFSRLNSSSFLGNSHLCGPVVNVSCPSPQHKHHRRMRLSWLLVVVALSALLVIALIIAVSRRYTTSYMSSTDERGPLKVFSLQQLITMTNNFDSANLIGRGGYSNVFKASWDGKTVAVKVTKQGALEEFEVNELRKSFFTEAKTLAIIRHRNIVKVLGYCWTKDKLALVMEYMPNGSLSSYLARTTVQPDAKLKIATEIAEAVHYIHHQFDTPLIHCDLKPENVLLDSDSVAKVADFGISKLVLMAKDNTISVSTFRGTKGYAPPEYAYSGVVSTKGDVYSYGMLLLVMITGKCPTDDLFRETGNLREWVLDNENGREDGASPGRDTEKLLVRVGLLCTNPNRGDRPTMKEVLAMLRDIRVIGHPIANLPSMDTLLEEPLHGA